MEDDLLAEFRVPGMAVVSGPDGAELVVAGDEDVVTFPVSRATKKTALRFAVGEPGRRSTVWRLWANAGTDDVYVASRQTAGEMKVSLHQSGDWRAQIVEPDRAKSVHFGARSAEDGRILHRWQRPEANAVGWTHAVTIVLPGDQLSVVPNDQVRWDDVRWLPAPGLEEQAEFDIYIVRPNLGMVSHRTLVLEGVRVSVMDVLQLSSGDVAIVTALVGPALSDELAMVARWEEEARKDSPPREWDRSAELGPRRLLFAVGSDGRQRFYDLALRDG
jgi:hypothetical protein